MTTMPNEVQAVAPDWRTPDVPFPFPLGPKTNASRLAEVIWKPGMAGIKEIGWRPSWDCSGACAAHVYLVAEWQANETTVREVAKTFLHSLGAANYSSAASDAGQWISDHDKGGSEESQVWRGDFSGPFDPNRLPALAQPVSGIWHEDSDGRPVFDIRHGYGESWDRITYEGNWTLAWSLHSRHIRAQWNNLEVFLMANPLGEVSASVHSKSPDRHTIGSKEFEDAALGVLADQGWPQPAREDITSYLDCTWV